MNYAPNDKYGLYFWVAATSWAQSKGFESDPDYELFGMFSELVKHPEVMRNTEDLQTRFGRTNVAIAFANVIKENGPAQRILLRYGLKSGEDSLLQYLEKSFLSAVDIAAPQHSDPVANRLRISGIATQLDHNVKPFGVSNPVAPAYSSVILKTEDLLWLREALQKIGSDWNSIAPNDANRVFGLIRGHGEHGDDEPIRDMLVSEWVAARMEADKSTVDAAAEAHNRLFPSGVLFAGKSKAKKAFYRWIDGRPLAPKRGKNRRPLHKAGN